jgi:hypothetical protein
VIVARPDARGELALAAYYVARAASTLAAGTLQPWLRERLPEYMVPSSYTALAALPLTPSGKVDRLSLPAPDNCPQAPAASYLSPDDATEQAIAAIWQAVLLVERVGSTDNFFELGGTSLRMLEVNRRLCEHLQRAIPVLQMYQHPTVQQPGALPRRWLAASHLPAAAGHAGRFGNALHAAPGNPESLPRPPARAIAAPAPRRVRVRRQPEAGRKPDLRIPAASHCHRGYLDMNPPAAIPHRNESAIAIVGMSCRFPGADDVAAFWRNLEQGVESISFFSEAELLAAQASIPPSSPTRPTSAPVR